MELDVILKVAATIFLTSLTIFVIYLIFYFNSLNKMIKSMTENILQFSRSIQETLADVSKKIDFLKEKIETSLDHLDSTSVQIKKSFENIDQKVDALEKIYKPFAELSEYVYQRVAPPLQTTSRIISGLSKGVNVFVDMLSRKNKGEQ